MAVEHVHLILSSSSNYQISIDLIQSDLIESICVHMHILIVVIMIFRLHVCTIYYIKHTIYNIQCTRNNIQYTIFTILYIYIIDLV